MSQDWRAFYDVGAARARLARDNARTVRRQVPATPRLRSWRTVLRYAAVLPTLEASALAALVERARVDVADLPPFIRYRLCPCNCHTTGRTGAPCRLCCG